MYISIKCVGFYFLFQKSIHKYYTLNKLMSQINTSVIMGIFINSAPTPKSIYKIIMSNGSLKNKG